MTAQGWTKVDMSTPEGEITRNTKNADTSPTRDYERKCVIRGSRARRLGVDMSTFVHPSDRSVSIARCPDCRAVTLGPCDPSPLTTLGEAMAQLGGITTHQLIPAGDGWQVVERTAELIEHLPAGDRVDVLPVHRCGRCTPEAWVAASVHARVEKLTKRTATARWGEGSGSRVAAPIRCICGAWCLGGLDGDLGALWRLVEAYPVSEYGRALAITAGRRLALLTPFRRGGVRLQHSWDPLPRGTPWHLWVADHRCHQPLPAAEIPDLTTKTDPDDPWRTNAKQCPF